MKRITPIIFFLCLLFSSTCSAQNSEHQDINLYKANGYLEGQKMKLKKIRKKFPDLSNSVEKVKLEFDLSFGNANDAITAKLKKIMGENFNDYKSKRKQRISKYLQNQKITRKHALKFITNVHNRSKGGIRSPILETLLAYQFKNFPAKEFTSGFTTIYSTKKDSKAKGLNIKLEIPQSWDNEETRLPDIVQKFTSENGKGKEFVFVTVKNLPTSDNHQFTKKESSDFFTKGQMKEMLAPDSKFISARKIFIDNYPGGQIKYKEKSKRIDIVIKQQGIDYVTIYKDKLIFFQCMVGGTGKGDLDSKFDKFYPLFRQIANSIIFPDQYK
jgi:hypothetical protein